MKLRLICISIAILFMVFYSGCKHEPDVNMVNNPGNVDTTKTAKGNPCSPDTVYFERDILPLLGSNCALSGCHDAHTAMDGVIYSDYETMIKRGKITPGKPNSSKMYTEIDEGNMPPYPNTPLTLEQKALIYKWILQGAQNLTCTDCDTTDITWTKHVSPIIDTYCKGCHQGSTPNGNVNLSTYDQVKVQALNGNLFGVTSHASGYKPMPPYGSNTLDKCQVKAIEKWVAQGALQN